MFEYESPHEVAVCSEEKFKQEFFYTVLVSRSERFTALPYIDSLVMESGG